MDPNAALKKLLDALPTNDRVTALEAAIDLKNWIRSGGFLPTDPRLDRTLTTKVVEQKVSTAVLIEVAGWRIDVHLGEDSDTKPSHHMVNIANVALDGPDAGWCACAHDNDPEPTTAPLLLDGSERE
jgi:hypothetical protein